MPSRYEQPYFAIISRHFATVVDPGASSQFEGNDHVGYVVDGVAFRFPKLPREIDAGRAAFLEQLREMIPLPVPVIETHQDRPTGIWYETYAFIPGVSFYPSVAQTFSHHDLMAVARQLGAFLGAVHAFPIDQARGLGIDEMRPEGFSDYMEHHPDALPMVKRLAYPFISRREQAWVEALFKDYIALIRCRPFRTRVTHSDMWPDHIIVDPEERRVTGVIDFWGRIADPANDLKAFEHYGHDFVKQIYRYYPLAIDEDFDKRRLFYTGHDEVFQLARAIERGNESDIGTRRRSLLNYIDAHSHTLG